MIEQLYGVIHSTKIWPIGFLRVEPSREIKSELLNLPTNTLVGIEHSPKFDKPFLLEDGSKGYITPPQRYYWNEIRQICKKAGHKIVYLEDFATFQEYNAKAVEFNKLMKELSEDEKESSPNGVNIDIKNRAYKLQVECDYIFKVKREKAILSRIQKYQPSVVILGKGHTDYLMSNPSIRLNKNGIHIQKYQTEELQLDFFDMDHPKYPIDTTLREGSSLEAMQQIELNRILLERSFKAVTEGCITNRTPDFIGTWDTDIPARGLFEIHLNKDENNRFTGIIQDSLGDAIFSGQIDEDQVSFTKIYFPDFSSEEAFHDGRVSYTGKRDGDLYKGYFEFVHNNGAIKEHRQFSLRKNFNYK